MPGVNIDLTGLTAAVTKVKGVNASVKEFLAQIETRVQKAVADALAADDAADQGSVDAANAAISSVVADLSAEADSLGAAIVAPAPPPTT